MESFASLERFPFLRHTFITRIPRVDVDCERHDAIARLQPAYEAARTTLGLDHHQWAFCEQIHGSQVTVLENPPPPDAPPTPGSDALITALPGVILGIYVADCCAIYFADPTRRVIALAHSGRKGTDAQIARITIETMCSRFGCCPADIVAQLSPCIRPPHYEVDFAADIRHQCAQAGVRNLHDCRVCTASHPERYYSYRREKGRTGRMLALLALSLH